MQYERLKYIHFFKDIEHSYLTSLSKLFSVKHYNKGDIIFMHEDSIEYSYIITSGWVKLFRETLDGQEIIFGLSTTNDMLGEVDFNRQTYSFGAQAVDKTEVIKFPYRILKEIVENNSKFALKIVTLLNSTINQLGIQFEHITSMSAAQRIGCFILRLCSGQDKRRIEIKLPYDKTLIAAYLGMKRETFSRGLNELKSLGIIIKNNRMLIKDLYKLIDFSCISCSLTFDSCKK